MCTRWSYCTNIHLITTSHDYVLAQTIYLCDSWCKPFTMHNNIKVMYRYVYMMPYCVAGSAIFGLCYKLYSKIATWSIARPSYIL